MGARVEEITMRRGGLLTFHMLMTCGKMSSKHVTYKLCVLKYGGTIHFMNSQRKVFFQ